MTNPPTDADREYRENLNEHIEQNIGIARAVADHIKRKFKDFSYGRYTYDELCQSAYYGLVKAAAYFDPEAAKFSTYAWHSCYRQVCHDMRVDRLIKGSSRPDKLSAETAERDRQCAAIQLVDTTEDPNQFVDDSCSPCDEAEGGDEWQRYHAIVATLPEKWRLILERRMAGVKLQTIGKDLGITKERVRQIESQTIREIRKQLGYEPLKPRARDLTGTRTHRTYFARKEVAR